MSACAECARPATRLKRGLCCACYERARWRAYRVASHVAPCALCGEPGPRSTIGVPIRHDARPMGVPGDVCARCAASYHAELTYGYSYRWRRLYKRSAA
jgi:hypothetical protein